MYSAKVWSERTATRKHDNSVLKLRFQELSSDLLDDVVDVLMTHFVPDETLHVASKIDQSADARKEYHEKIAKYMFDSALGIHTVVCCLENEGKLKVVGVSLMQLCTMEESLKEILDIIPMLETKEVLKFINIVADIISEEHTVMQEYLSQKLYDDRGIMVHRDFRRLGISTEFLRVRRMICKERGVPVTAAWMTALATQKAGETDGWETIKEIRFDELGKKHGVQFIDAPEFAKLMIARIK